MNAPTAPLPPSILEVLAERERQLAQGVRTIQGDDRLARGELAIASALYLLMGTDATVHEPFGVRDKVQSLGRRANLVRAITLGLAELERLDRVGGTGGAAPEGPGGGLGRAAHPTCVDRCDSPVCFNCK